MADKAELLREIKKLQGEINTLGKDSASLTDTQIKQQRELKKLIVERIGQVKELNKERLSILASEESSMGSLGSMYDNLTTKQKQALDISYNGQQKNLEPATKILEINRSLSQLTPDDEYQRLKLMSERGELMDSLDGRSRKLVSSLKEQNGLADSYANMTESQKRILQSQHDVLDGIKNTIVGTIETAVTLYGNLQGAIGGVISGLGFVADKIGDANKQLGTTLFQTDGVARKAGVLSFIFDDAVSNAKDLSAELGDTARASFEAQTNIGLMSMNMGISGSEAVALTGAFTRLNGNSSDIAFDMVATSREFAKQNGIIPAQLMSDLAGSAEEFALYGKRGGQNILQAAGYAAKLGTNMKTLSGIADGLLDFESSITKELELGAMLGKNINLNRARALAYEGDIAGATKETLAQLGGIEAFNRMDYFQKKQTADLLGVSVAELQKMATNMENANTTGAVLSSTFSQMGEFIDGGLNKWLGTSLKTMGGMVTAAAQVGGGFAQMGFNVKDTLKSLKDKAFSVFSKGTSVASQATPSVTSNLPDSKTGGGGQNSIVKSISKIKPSQILAGAAALVIVAGAVFVFGKAVQEFMKVSWESVGMAVVSMLALVGAVALLGAIMSSGVGAVAILAGAAAMLVVATSVYVLGKALQEMATGFSMISTLGTQLSGLISIIPGIFGLAAAFTTLGASLAVIAVAGMAALPALLGMAAVGAGIGFLVSAVSGDDGESGTSGESVADYQVKMLNKLEEIRVATATNRDVYLDKEKVTRLVVATDERNSVNKFSLNNG